MVVQYYVICYDISKTKNRSKVADILEEYGVRVNKSVFECTLSSRQKEDMFAKIEPWVDPESDNILCYPLCKSCIDRASYLHPPKPLDKVIVV
jgi:CRISPR-associated protein Cas2